LLITINKIEQIIPIKRVEMDSKPIRVVRAQGSFFPEKTDESPDSGKLWSLKPEYANDPEALASLKRAKELTE